MRQFDQRFKLDIGIFFVGILIGMLIGYYAGKSAKEPFCNCQGEGSKVCPDPKVLQALYSSGMLTEYTDLDKLQRHPRWTK